MVTQTTPIIHTFKEINVGKYTWVKHYELKEVINGKSLLSNSINISKDRQFSRANPDYWLKKRIGNKWSGYITGLFKTTYKNIYKGDIDNKKHLVIFKFSDDESIVTIAIYQHYFSNDLNHLFTIFDK